MATVRSFSAAATAVLFAATTCLADARVEQKTQFQLGGVVGGIVKVFGGKAAREGLTSTTSVRGKKRLTVTDRSGELVDLGEEKIYRIDYGRKSYEIVTFDEIRRQLEEAKKEAAEEAGEKPKKNEGPEYEIDVTVKETGEKQKIAGYDTRQVITTITVREKGKKLEQSGGAVLTADMWMGPKLAAMAEINAFNQKYFMQLYGDSLAEMQQMAVLMATTPTFAKAMKEFARKRSSFEGEAIRTNLKFETVAAPGAQGEEEEEGGGGLVGGLLGRAMKRRQDPEAKPGRAQLFASTSDILSVSTDAGDVGLPAGFKLRD